MKFDSPWYLYELNSGKYYSGANIDSDGKLVHVDLVDDIKKAFAFAKWEEAICLRRQIIKEYDILFRFVLQNEATFFVSDELEASTETFNFTSEIIKPAPFKPEKKTYIIVGNGYLPSHGVDMLQYMKEGGTATWFLEEARKFAYRGDAEKAVKIYNWNKYATVKEFKEPLT